MLSRLQMDYEDLKVEHHKSASSETVYKQQIKENKEVLKTLKNKLIEVEGIVREFGLFEKVTALEHSKHARQMEAKDRELVTLRERVQQLESQSGNLEKRFTQLNPPKAATLPDVANKKPAKRGDVEVKVSPEMQAL